MSKPILALVLASAMIGPLAAAGVAPGDIPVDETSLHCIGLRWPVGGDVGADTTVEVAYRKAGADRWRKAMGLFRVESEALEDRKPPEGVTIFAGSIFSLAPGTRYNIRLTLDGPDREPVRKLIDRTTWSEPAAPAPKRTLHVVPGDGGGAGSKDDPLKGLKAAAQAASPGDLVLLASGVYAGPLMLTTDGAAEAPIVFRGSADGESIVEGPAGGTAVVARKRKHIYLERLSIRKAAKAIAVDGAEHLVIRRCNITDVKKGINDDALAHRLFIGDNVVEGRLEYGLKHRGEDRGIELSGTGHVICYNRVSRFRDAIDTRNPWPVRDVDIHNNDCSQCEDDGIELDFSEHNVRAYENRLTNCSMGISFQPSRGGPNYAIRNILYNIRGESFKLHLTPTNRRAPNWKVGPHRTSGGVIIHNTIVKEGTALRVWSDEGPVHYFYARNNLLVGSPAHYCIDIGPPMRHADFDYNAYVAEDLKKFANWNENRYNTIDQFREATGLERNGLVLKQFEGVFAAGVKLPEDAKTVYPIANNAPQLAEDSPVIDKGQVIPNMNEAYKGKAPDIGAWEFGGKRPHYGPRPE